MHGFFQGFAALIGTSSLWSIAEADITKEINARILATKLLGQ
jgi:hypothetical protein